MEIKELSISELTPYANNPRQNDGAVDAVKASIAEFGFKVPIVIDKDGVIVAGHTRLKAAKALGLESVPCVVADDLTDEQVRAFRLADNKVAELATWDLEKLDLELSGIDLKMESFGFASFDDDDDEEKLEAQKREFEERMAAGELSEDSEEYQEFLRKFEAKKTTDDCYTPGIVYDAVADYVADRYGIKRTVFVRPFVPGGDYERFNYPKGCAVVDNPPFSILSQICKFYDAHNIKFFLFAPALTPFSCAAASRATVLCTGVNVTYDNGANVNTSFVTNMEGDVAFRTAPELYEAVRSANEERLRDIHKQLPKYQYPLEVVAALMLTPYSRYGIEFEVKRDECHFIRSLDSQKESGKAIFGGGYLISEAKKAEREKAEREKAEREKAERWQLSDQELEIIRGLK